MKDATADFEDIADDAGAETEIAAELDRLSRLSDLDYEKERISAAKRLGVRTVFLDIQRRGADAQPRTRTPTRRA